INQPAFSEIAAEPAKCSTTDQNQRRKSETSAHEIDIELPDGKIDKANAARAASVFVRKLNPSGLPVEESAALKETRHAAPKLPGSTSPALQYGLWWHQFVQKLNWSGNTEVWERTFD